MGETPSKEIPSGEKQKQRSQVIENPCTQIFEFMHPKLDNKYKKSFERNSGSGLLKCPSYESDEFADVEDNAKDSSSDNNESTSDVKRTILVQQDIDFFPDGEIDAQADKLIERTTTVFIAESDSSNDKNGPSISHYIQSYNIGASCSHTHEQDPEPISDSTKLEENEMTFKIAEVADFNDKKSPKDGKSSRHKANSLKMKTKVGMRKDKCNVCRVRLGLCAIKCRCGGYYCAKHRYDKEHNCTFDYKSMGAEEIRKNNPRIIAEKIRKL